MIVRQADLGDFREGKYDPPKTGFDRWMDLQHEKLDPIRREMWILSEQLGKLLGDKPNWHRGFETYKWTELKKLATSPEILQCIRRNLELHMTFEVEMERVDLMDVLDREESGEEQAMTWEEAVVRIPDFAACVARDPKGHDVSLKNVEGIRKWLEKQR